MKSQSKIIVVILALVVMLISFLGRSLPKERIEQIAEATAIPVFTTRHYVLGDANDTTPSVYVDIEKLTFDDSSAVSQKIEKTISEVSFNALFGDTLSSDETFESAFEKRYGEYVAEKPAHHRWELKLTITPLLSTEELFSCAISQYQYTGGAHGNYSTINLVFSRKSGELISAKSLIKTEDMPKLTAAAEQKLRSQQNIAPDSTLNSAGYWFTEDIFTLNDNIALTDSSLTIYYAPYEIAPYALGETVIEIPFSQCKDWLTVTVE